MQRGARLTQTRATRSTCTDWPAEPMVGQFGSRDPTLWRAGQRNVGSHLSWIRQDEEVCPDLHCCSGGA